MSEAIEIMNSEGQDIKEIVPAKCEGEITQKVRILVLEVARRGDDGMFCVSGQELLDDYSFGDKYLRIVKNKDTEYYWGFSKDKMMVSDNGNPTEFKKFDVIGLTVRKQKFEIHDGQQNENYVCIENGYFFGEYIGRFDWETSEIIYNASSIGTKMRLQDLVKDPPHLWYFNNGNCGRCNNGKNDCVHQLAFENAKEWDSIYMLPVNKLNFYKLPAFQKRDQLSPVKQNVKKQSAPKDEFQYRLSFTFKELHYDLALQDLPEIEKFKVLLDESEKKGNTRVELHGKYWIIVSLLLPYKPRKWDSKHRFKVVGSIILDSSEEVQTKVEEIFVKVEEGEDTRNMETNEYPMRVKEED